MDHIQIIENNITYKLIKEIGKGTFARVYLAKTLGQSLERYVAIKLVDVSAMAEKQQLAIMDEAKILGSLAHPNIIHIYDCGMVEGKYFFIACELLDGYTLKEVISRHTQAAMKRMSGIDEIPLSLMKHAAASILMNSVLGLGYMHNASDILTGSSIKVIHNDLKPSNILIGMNGSLKVSDFGISYSKLRTVKLKGGTPAYMSPEWIAALLDNASKMKPNISLDIYSLGICLHETLTDRRLFKAPGKGSSREEIMSSIHDQMKELKPGFTKKVNPAADKFLCEIVDRCLAFDPNERYQTMKEIVDEMDELISKNYFHPEILDRRFLAEYMESLFKEGGLKRFRKSGKHDLK